MSTRCLIHCEGESDKRFLECLLAHLGISGVKIKSLGGISKLGTLVATLARDRDRYGNVAVVADADADAAQQRDEIVASLDEGLESSKVFLLPNNQEPGCLETLLEQLAVERHREIYECLDQLEECLLGLDAGYRGPELKGRIYAYCEAVGIKVRERERDYTNQEHWNLDAPAIRPLVRFLEQLH